MTRRMTRRERMMRADRWLRAAVKIFVWLLLSFPGIIGEEGSVSVFVFVCRGAGVVFGDVWMVMVDSS